MRVDYRVLGPVEVWAGGEQLDIGGARQRRLIGALVLADGRPITAERLVEIVWTGEPPDQARNTLRTYVARARRVLEVDGPAPLVTDVSGWRLERLDDAVDGNRFESLLTTARSLSADPIAGLAAIEEALALWRGDAFAEFDGEDWCAGEAVRLNELRLFAEEERFEAMLGCGLYDDVIGELERFNERHPLRDRPRAQLMLALYRAGRQVEAVRQYQDYRQYLDAEVGVEPSDELRALEQRIINRDPSLLQRLPARRQLRGYELGSQIGEGAFGRIYRARQPTLGREVAIKMVRPDLADAPAFIQRFDAEAQFIARLEHPHIVPLFDYWREPGGAYLVMRYFRGGNAQQLLESNGPLPLSRVSRIVDEIGGALATAHDQGVVHCDVKPANILFDDDGASYLGDFGIALGVGTSPSFEPESIASAVYLSPEQAAQGVAAPSADIYAFGAVLYELLAGEAAFRADTSIPDLMDSKRMGALTKLTQFRADLPGDVDEVVARAMAPDPDDRYADIAEMVMAFHTATASRVERRPTPLVLSRRNPYKGLAAFDEADAADFFGRDELVDRLAGRVAHSRFVAVVGPSGSGKSSLVRAGLAPRLRAQGDFVVAMIPGAHPVEELTRALLQATPVTQAESTREALGAEGTGLVDAAALSLSDSQVDLVVIIDQFEELFTISDDLERDEFLHLIAAAACDDAGRVRVIATIRADFYDRPLSHREIGELVQEHTVAVTPLAPAGLERAITGPATRAGVVVEPGLVAALIADSAGSPASLPLVQYVLTNLYDRRQGDVLEMAMYHQRGGLTGAVARRADELYEQCDQAGKEGVRRLFNRLVVPGEGAEDTRRRVRRSELPTVPAQVIESYGAARLLTFDNDPTTREPTVEVAHEALIREWPLLRTWLDSDRNGLRIIGHLAGATDAWIESDRDPDELYRGGRLESVEDWLAAHPSGLNERELELVNASASARDAVLAEQQQRYDGQLRSNRRLRRLLAGVGTFAILALVAGMFAVQQSRRADDEAAEADFERLVALASTLPEQDLQLGMLAAVEAFDRQDRPESRAALQEALMAEPRFAGRVLSVGDAGPPTAGPNGEWLFTTEVVPGEEASRGTWYDATTLEPMGSVTVEERWRLVSSPDRTLIAATWLEAPGGRFGSGPDARLIQVRLHDATGQELAVLVATGQPTAVRFLDADRLAVSDSAGLTIWDVRTFEPEQTIVLPGSPRLEAIDVNEDGSLLLVSSPEWRGGVALMIDVDGGSAVPETVTPCEGRCAVGFAPSGDVVAVGEGRKVVLRDTASWEVISTINAPDNLVDSLDFSADGATLYVGTFGGDIAFYGVRTGERSAPSIDGRAGAILAVMTAPMNHIVTIATPGVIQRWSADSSGPFGTWLESGDGFGVFAPDGSRFVRTNDPDVGWVTVYDPATGAVMEELELIPEVPLGALAFSPDGGLLAIATDIGDVVAGRTRGSTEILDNIGDIVLYDGETFEPTGQVLADQGIAFPTFSPDGQSLAVGANFTARWPFVAHVWQIDTGDVTVLELTADFEGAGRPTWSPDGTRVAISDFAGGDGVFDAVTGRQIGSRFSVRGQGEAREVRWEPDGSSLLGVGAPGISRWDVATGERTSPFADSTSGQWIDLAADGQLLVTASEQSEARLWDLEAEVPVGIPFPDPGLVGILRDNQLPPVPALSPDGRYLAMSGGNGTVLWTLDPEVWRELACELAGRNMTENEWANVMGDVPYETTCDRWAAG